MLWFFFDTSAIVKLFHSEKGTGVVDKIISSVLDGNHKAIISALVILEFVSAFRKKVSSKEITWKEFIDTVISFLQETTEKFGLLPIESGAYTNAVDYVIKYGLFAPDSLHITSMDRITQTVEKSKIILVSADAKLCKCAEQEGFKTLNPEQVTIIKIDGILKE